MPIVTCFFANTKVTQKGWIPSEEFSLNFGHTVLVLADTNNFIQKNSGIATTLTKQGWKKLKDAGLTAELDSSRHWMQGYMYYRNRQRILELYRADKKVMYSHLRDLNNRKPQMIRLLDGLNHKANIRKEENNNVGKDFVW